MSRHPSSPLQPSAADAAMIKAAIEKLHVSDDSQEDEL
jgi:hypothetical protein